MRGADGQAVEAAEHLVREARKRRQGAGAWQAVVDRATRWMVAASVAAAMAPLRLRGAGVGGGGEREGQYYPWYYLVIVLVYYDVHPPWHVDVTMMRFERALT